MRRLRFAAVLIAVSPMVFSCATSREDQRESLTHQKPSHEAAKRGTDGVAADEQRSAEDSHHDAVDEAREEGSPTPRQTRPGDRPSP